MFDPFDIKTQAEVDKIMSEFSAELRGLKGKRVRAVRVVVFEGEADGVLAQIARSTICGVRGMKWGTLTIVQGPVEVVVETKPESGPQAADE